jgi:hypothetical protein
MANQINGRGQIVGMGTVLSGRHAGETQAFLATPVNASIGKSVADVVQARPKSNTSTNGNQFLQKFRLSQSGQRMKVSEPVTISFATEFRSN